MSAATEPTTPAASDAGADLPPTRPPVDTTEPRPRHTREAGFGEPRANWIAYVVLGLGLVIVTSPFIWKALSSLKGEGEIRRVPPTWLPEAPTLDNFRELFDRLDFPQPRRWRGAGPWSRPRPARRTARRACHASAP